MQTYVIHELSDWKLPQNQRVVQRSCRHTVVSLKKLLENEIGEVLGGALRGTSSLFIS